MSLKLQCQILAQKQLLILLPCSSAIDRNRQKTIPCKEYKALRWKSAELKAGDAVVVSIRVKSKSRIIKAAAIL